MSNSMPLSHHQHVDNQQISTRWKMAGELCSLSYFQVCALDLQLREVKKQRQSRLDYVLQRKGGFEKSVHRAAALIFLLQQYHTNRRLSIIAHQKWLKSREHLLSLQQYVPESQTFNNFCNDLARQSTARPPRPSYSERYFSR